MYMYQVKVSYERQTEVGMAKVTEQYLVDAMSFTEAEERIIKEVQPYVSIGELEVVNIKRCKYAELLLSDDDRLDKYYRAKVSYIGLDEKSGQEKVTSVAMLVMSDSLPRALDSLVNEMKQQLSDYRIDNIAETPIMAVYKYQ